jgi:hypothetical protein
VALGDNATEEAYYNLARRLGHRGLLKTQETDRGLRYFLGADVDKQWLEEDDLSGLIDPDYPLLALAVWREAARQVSDIPERVWQELRERLRSERARDLFYRAIVSYCAYFRSEIADLIELDQSRAPELTRRRAEADNTLRLLLQMTKYGLGLSAEAVSLPLSIELALKEFKASPLKSYVDERALAAELKARIADEAFIVDIEAPPPARPPLVAAVDGSTRGGLLLFPGEQGDFSVGHAPMVSINTSVGVVNRRLSDRRNQQLFLRLPERPEDIQRRDNRYTVMAKLLFPDQSDAQFMHSVWNAMDLLEARAVLRVLNPWPIPKTSTDVPPADVVLRDGTVSPQDRDFNHYSDPSTYGRIVAEMIQTHWDIALKSRDGHQTVAGVVKIAQLRVFGPVVNWYASQLAGAREGQIATWPMQTLNSAPDQMLLTRLLTAGRRKEDPWTRTCLILRPFHALTNFSKLYSRRLRPSQIVLSRHEEALRSPDALDQDKRIFWETFRPESDPYLKLLDNVHYGGVFVAPVPRLDTNQTLPRLEFLVASPTREEEAQPWAEAFEHLRRMAIALKETGGFDVAAEHDMFTSPPKIDVLPKLILRAHDTVKLWAADLMSRVHEYVGHLLARYVKGKRIQGVKVRPFSRAELERLLEQLKRAREIGAGKTGRPELEGGDGRGP